MTLFRPLAIAIFALSPAFATAQNYPTKPVTMMVNFPPGGATDLAGRALGAALGPLLGQPIIIENKGGAGGAIGVGAVAASPVDGYHAGFVAVAALTTLPQMRKVPYRIDSLDYVCQAFDAPVFMLVTQASRFKTARDLVTFAKAHPGDVNYATVGPGSLPHMAALDFAKKAGITLTHIPFQGEAPAVTNLLGGHVDLYFGTNAVASTHKLRRLGVAAAVRVKESQSTPTLGEQGWPVNWSVMGGVIAPAGMDAQARDALEKACKSAVDAPGFRNALANLNLNRAYASGAEFKSRVLSEAGKNRVMLRDAGLLAE